MTQFFRAGWRAINWQDFFAIYGLSHFELQCAKGVQLCTVGRYTQDSGAMQTLIKALFFVLSIFLCKVHGCKYSVSLRKYEEWFILDPYQSIYCTFCFDISKSLSMREKPQIKS